MLHISAATSLSVYNPAIEIHKKLFTLLDLCVSSLRRGHANLLCIVPILTDDPRRESEQLQRAGVPRFVAKGSPLSHFSAPADRHQNAGRWYVLATQRSLHPVLSCYLCTARGNHFCLLCCQPAPVRSLSCARTAQLTPRSPCAPRAC